MVTEIYPAPGGGPTEEPVSLQEAKDQCRVEHDEEDVLLASVIQAAREWAEQHTGRAFCTQTWEARYDSFPAAGERLEVPKPPLQAVASVKYLDGSGTEQTWAASDYLVLGVPLTSADQGGQVERGHVVPASGKSWPATLKVPEAVRVRFTCGYGKSEKVPVQIKRAILLKVADLYLQREPQEQEATAADRNLLGSFRSPRVA